MTKMKNVITIGAIFGALAVVIGAFGAHALKESLSVYELGVFRTGSAYHFYHALALIAYGVYGENREIPNWPAWSFIFGIFVFSGSLYGLAVLQVPKLGMLTPLGGVGFIAGWIGFAIAARKNHSTI
jgi:uncharacterized membrane protein YgdD (TMEM256/DUF423 family)